jgi:hypothetical protein
MREPQAGCSDRYSLTGPLSTTAVQRDDQTLAGSPGEQRRREQQRRQQVQGTFSQRRGNISVQYREDERHAQAAACEHREPEPSDGRWLPASHNTGCSHKARSYGAPASQVLRGGPDEAHRDRSSTIRESSLRPKLEGYAGHNPEDATQMSVRLGAFDGDPGVRPSRRTYTAHAAVWEPILDDGLTRYPQAKPEF